MAFDHEEYKTSLLKILDIARESHWYLLDRVTSRQLDIAKTYLWVSSVIGAVVMFMVREASPAGLTALLLSVSIVFVCPAFILSMLVLWGKPWGESSDALTDTMNLATFSYERLITEEASYDDVYAGIIGSISQANDLNRATNTRRATTLRIAAPFLILSFMCVMVSILLRALNV